MAVGSSIGHAIGGLFTGGGGSEAPLPQEQPQQQQGMANNSNFNCAGATQSFTKCMDDHNGNMSICNWYLDQLKACQSAASQY